MNMLFKTATYLSKLENPDMNMSEEENIHKSDFTSGEHGRTKSKL